MLAAGNASAQSPRKDAKTEQGCREGRTADPRTGHLHPLRKAAAGLREARPRGVPALREVSGVVAGGPGEDPPRRRAEAARRRPDHRDHQRGDGGEGRGPREGPREDRGLGRGMERDLAATERRGHHRRHARRQAGRGSSATPGEDYRLLIEKKGKQPESMELNLEYARAISRMPGQNSVSFQAPQAPVSRWRIVIPQAGVKVNLFPLIAATEVPAEAKPEAATGKKPDETVVLAFVGAAPLVRIDWTPKAEGATGLAAMASVQTEQQLWLSEGVVRTRATLNYSISRAELGQLVIDVPADQKVVNVFDANVRQWSVEPVEGRQRITAELFEPAKASQQVIVELEKFAAEKAKDTVAAPVVKAVGVGRQQGVIVVQVAESLRAEAAKTSGLLQVDAGELPAALRRAMGVRLSLRHGSLRVGLRRREGAAADHGRFAAGGPAAARAARAWT